MQMKVITLAIPALAMFSFAQTQDPQQQDRQQQGTRTESQTSTTTEHSATQEEQRPVRHARTDQEGKARNYRGTLVDASCAQNMARAGAGGAPTTAERSGSQTTTESQTSTESQASKESETSTESKRSETSAERSGTMGAAGSSHVDTKAVLQSCPVTSASNQFALVTSDGHFYKFNSEGDSKVASELKTNSKWNKAMTGNKKIMASVRGTLEGDTLQVESVK
jgi:hypothetical protein